MAYNEKIKFMTYNVWSNEHVAVYRRIQAISKLIVRHEPHVIFLQSIKLPINALKPPRGTSTNAHRPPHGNV
uniref:Endonuclease/exonuclease/phosphatase domain-containing protein n=1 Tax=Oryza sativa subsp. japonica TaxID=39947 RepID=Q6Z4A3_ORYSJ|nr:hypothetical protein [Oryza sativa Japonica Group]